jgi:hypothetical protein
MKGGKEDGGVAGIGIQPNGELAQMARSAVHNGTVNGGAALAAPKRRLPRPSQASSPIHAPLRWRILALKSRSR